MPKDSQRQLMWGLIVTIAIAALSWIGSGMLSSYRFGQELGQMVVEKDAVAQHRMIRAEVSNVEDECNDKIGGLARSINGYQVDQALWRGEVDEKLSNIENLMEKIERKLP